MRKKNLFCSRGFVLAAVFLVPLAVYSVTLGNGFVGDDVYIVLNNRWITGARHIPEIFSSSVWSFVSGGPTSNYYRPMMHLAYMAVYPFSGTEAWGYHLVNILLHSANTVLVFYLAEALWTDKASDEGRGEDRHGFLPPFLAAALFALHPLNTEVVSWIAAVPELTFTFFFLLSFNMYARADAPSPGARLRYALSALFFLLALFCKETAIVLPAVLVVYDFSRKGFAFIKKPHIYAPFAALALLYLAARSAALGGVVHHRNIELTPYGYLLNVLPIIPRYVMKFIMPFPLKASYVFHQKTSFFEPAVAASFLFTAAYAGAVVFLRKNRVAFLALLWIAIALAPTLYIPVIPGGFAERYFYLPSAAACVLVVHALKRRFEPRPDGAKAVLLFLAALLAFYAAADVSRALVWKNNATLWADSVKKTPDNAPAHANLAWAFQKEGDIEGAIREYREVIRIGKEKATESFINLGGIYMERGDYPEAIAAMNGALERAPNNASVHFNIAVAHVNAGDKGSAIRHFKEAIRLNPRNDNAYYNLAWTYQASGDNEAAIFFYNEAVRLAPQNPDAHYNLGIIHEQEGRMEEAAREFYQTYRIDPGYKDARARLNNAVLKKQAEGVKPDGPSPGR